MLEAAIDILPSAVVRLASPLPIALVIVLMSLRRGTVKAWLFVLGWLLGGMSVMGPVLVLAIRSPLGREDSPLAAWAQVGFGALFVALAGWTAWRMRTPHGQRRGTERWLARIDQASAMWSLGVGWGFGALGGPKNIAVLMQAPLTVSRADLGVGAELGLLAAFDVVSTLGVALPLMVRGLWPRSTDRLLQACKTWLLRHSDAILLVVFAVFGPLLLVRGGVALM